MTSSPECPSARPSIESITNRLTRQMFHQAISVKENEFGHQCFFPVNQSDLPSIFPNNLQRLKSTNKRIVEPYITLNVIWDSFFHVSGEFYHEDLGSSFAPSITVEVFNNEFPIPKTLRSHLYKEIRETLRHELVHADQPYEEFNYGDVLSDMKPLSLDWWSHYLLQDQEAEAFAHSLYMTAKRTHIPFRQAIFDRLSVYFRFIKDGSDEEKEYMLAHAEDRMIQHVLRRFPRAQLF